MSTPLALVEQHYRNVSNGQIDAEDQLFSPAVETLDPSAGTLPNLEAFKAYERAFQRAFPDGKLVLESAIQQGNRVAVEGAFTGTHTGPLASPQGEIPATNRAVNLRVSDIFEVSGELITKHRIYYDQVQLLSQLGLPR
ncbi:MAG: ester cyclase [Chloroflexota bacterium]|nr:ester cyclase [Chloroflexota bacterium]